MSWIMRPIFAAVAFIGPFSPLVARGEESFPPPAAETPAVRQIAPDVIPTYRSDPAAAPPAPTVVPPTDEHPLGGCERGTREWSNCLRLTSELADRMLDALVGQIISTPPADRTAMARLPLFSRGLQEAQRRFRALRDFECQQLRLYESHTERTAYDARMICMIERSMDRFRELRRRYPQGQ